MTLLNKHNRLFVSVVVLFFITVILLLLVDLFTFRIRPGGHLSGNGNPALLFVFPLVPLYLLFLSLVGIMFGLLFYDGFQEKKFYVGLFSGIVIIAIILGLLETLYYSEIFYSLGVSPDQPNSTMNGWGHFNQYSNTAYINIATYSCGIAIAIICGYWIALIVRLREIRKFKKS